MLLNPVSYPADKVIIFLEKYNPDRDQILKIAFACLMVLNATFNNVSVISLRSVLLVEKTTDLLQVADKLYHIMLCTSP
jgi:hypothetical protein